MFKTPQPDGELSAWDVKELATGLVTQLPMRGIEGSSLDSDQIWAAVILAAVNQTSVWEVCDETDETPCDDAVMH